MWCFSRKFYFCWHSLIWTFSSWGHRISRANFIIFNRRSSFPHKVFNFLILQFLCNPFIEKSFIICHWSYCLPRTFFKWIIFIWIIYISNICRSQLRIFAWFMSWIHSRWSISIDTTSSKQFNTPINNNIKEAPIIFLNLLHN